MSGHEHDRELTPADDVLPAEGEPDATPDDAAPQEGAVHGGGSGVGIAPGTGAGTGGGGPSAGSVVPRGPDEGEHEDEA